MCLVELIFLHLNMCFVELFHLKVKILCRAITDTTKYCPEQKEQVMTLENILFSLLHQNETEFVAAMLGSNNVKRFFDERSNAAKDNAYLRKLLASVIGNANTTSFNS